MKKIRLSLFLSLTTLCAIGQSKNFSIPTLYLDSLIWEARVGRSCTRLTNAQSIEISALTEQVFNQGKAISLQRTQISQLEASNSLLGERSALEATVAKDKNTRLKQRLRKAGIWIAGEGVGIIVLVLLLI